MRNYCFYCGKDHESKSHHDPAKNTYEAAEDLQNRLRAEFFARTPYVPRGNVVAEKPVVLVQGDLFADIDA